MASGTVTLTGGGGTEEVLAANANRDHVLIQLQSDHNVYFGFGENAVSAQGIALLEPGAWIKVTKHKARGIINGISTGNAVLGYETMEGIECGPGQFAGPWPLT